MNKEFPAEKVQSFIGKTVESIIDPPMSDEGLTIIFTDGSWITVGFSGNEGYIHHYECKSQ